MRWLCAPRTSPKLTPGGCCTDMRNKMLGGGDYFLRTATTGIALTLVGLYIPAQAQTPHSINLGIAQYLTFTTSSAWVLGDHRNEFRFHGFSQRSVDYYIFQDQRYSCRIL